MLQDRHSECGRLDHLLEGLRVGRSGALVLRGEPGIGKSALLEYLTEHASGWRGRRAWSRRWSSRSPGCISCVRLPQRLIPAVRDDAAPVRTKRHTLDRTGVAGQRSSAVLAGSGGTDGLPLRPAR